LEDNYEKNIKLVVGGEMGYFDGDRYVSFKLEGEHYGKI